MRLEDLTVDTLKKMRDAGTFQIVRELKDWVLEKTKIDIINLKEISEDLDKIEAKLAEMGVGLEDFSDKTQALYGLWKIFDGKLDKIQAFLAEGQKKLNDSTLLNEIKEGRFSTILKFLKEV
jgi:hypothetical protein